MKRWWAVLVGLALLVLAAAVEMWPSWVAVGAIVLLAAVAVGVWQ